MVNYKLVEFKIIQCLWSYLVSCNPGYRLCVACVLRY